MSSTAVKCASCNVVICELLSFVQNKINIMDEDSICRLCTTTYTKEEIAEAKDLLYDSVPAIKRKVLRKKEGRSQRDLEDIICLFKVTDPDITPIFVSRDLNKLPPVTFDHVDASKLLKDLIILRDNMRQFEENYVTREVFNSLRKDVDNLMVASIGNRFDCFVNPKRGTVRFHENALDSGPMGLLQESQHTESQSSSQTVLSDQNEQKHLSGVNTAVLTSSPAPVIAFEQPSKPAGSSGAQTGSLAASVDVMNVGQHYARGEQFIGEENVRNDSKLNDHPTYAESLRTGTENVQEEWNIVSRRKSNKNRFSVKLGTGVQYSDITFKAVENKVPILITNVHKETSEKDIVMHIHRKTQETVSLIKLSPKVEKMHNAYKLLVPSNKLHIFLDGSMWPKGIVFRRFINFNKLYRSEVIDASKILNKNGLHK